MNIKKNKLLIIVLLLTVTLIITGCSATTIKEVKSQDYIGETVRVSGTVQNTIKIGELSGYTLKDKTDTITVSSESLPTEGTKITITGTLMKDTLLGYYIKIS